MKRRNTVLRNVEYPEIGYPAEPRPLPPPRIFMQRLNRARERMAECGLDALVVYGDREGC